VQEWDYDVGGQALSAASPGEETMDKPETKAPVMNDVLQSDHHAQMSSEEIAKAQAHHDKKHARENLQKPSAKDRKGQPVSRPK
jgi:hypothetical protein